ncbi:hypothetical protein PVAG01_07424 [Phlyctema vagabunda]|uniref:Uncharacterized protein n=1 Tax=Phlyctema vagabunda TaxID=108571 RepID=A0ABR4PCF2_9HELO
MGEKSNRSKWRNKLSFRSNKTKTESSSHSVTSIPTSQLVLAGPSAASSRPRTPLSNPQSKVAIEFQNEDRSKRIDRVSLPPILKHPSTNPIILRAQEELQEAFEELQAELIKYTDKYSGYAPLRDADLMKAAAEGSEGFGEVIEQVLSDQEAKGQNLSSKVGKFMGNVYPIAGVVLGILSFSGDVRSQVLGL